MICDSSDLAFKWYSDDLYACARWLSISIQRETSVITGIGKWLQTFVQSALHVFFAHSIRVIYIYTSSFTMQEHLCHSLLPRHHGLRHVSIVRGVLKNKKDGPMWITSTKCTGALICSLGNCCSQLLPTTDCIIQHMLWENKVSITTQAQTTVSMNTRQRTQCTLKFYVCRYRNYVSCSWHAGRKDNT